MKLTKVHITEFQSIQDSTEFEIDDVTCLVGKNEAGKTALLKALYRLNPINEEDGEFDVTDDYPRSTMIEYENNVDAGRRKPAKVVQATYALEPDDITAVEETFGSECLKDENPTIILDKGYLNKRTFNGLNVNNKATLKYLVKTADLSQQLTNQLLELETAKEMVEVLDDAEETEGSQNLALMLESISEHGVSSVIYNQFLHNRIPKFLYFDEYYQLKGQDNIEALKDRINDETLEASDYPLLGLLELAGLDLDQLTTPRRTETLIAKLEAASNSLTQRLLPYWSQNQHLRIRFEIRPGQPEDPLGMESGTNIWGRVENTRHFVTTPLGTRSKGFVWFFSFLAWYSQFQKKDEKIILLLDEPGLSLHAKAQADLLRYFEEQLKPYHQLIYTTHSPFMVDSKHFARVRIVQDRSIEPNSDPLSVDQQGTKVITEVLNAIPDSLFPLQGALGYEISQTLFIGPNCLVVEGVSDLLYIQTISALLQKREKEGLSTDWTITPVGGASNVPTFVALIGAQEDLNVAVLIDYQKKDQQSIENLYKEKLLKQQQVLTYADFVERNEADVEDIFDADFYLKLVNGEFGADLTVDHLPKGPPRILIRLEKYFQNSPLPRDAQFNHYRPARYFSENIGSLEDELSGQTLARFEHAFSTLNKLL